MQGVRETECWVCRGDLTEPKILPCAHVVCYACVLRRLKAKDGNWCPICQAKIIEELETVKGKKQKGALEELVKALPTDMAMVALVKSAQIMAKDPICQVCAGTAKGLCLQCCDMLCDACIFVHSKLTVSRMHSVENLRDITARVLAAKQVPKKKESRVSDRLYCPIHGLTMCLFCAAARDGKIPEPEREGPDFDSELKEQRERDRIQEEGRAALRVLVNTLKEGMKKIRDSVNTCDRQPQALAEIAQKDSEAFVDAYAQMRAFLKGLRKSLVPISKELKAEAQPALQKLRLEVIEMRNKVSAIRIMAEEVADLGSIAYATAATKKIAESYEVLEIKYEMPGQDRGMVGRLFWPQEAPAVIEEHLDLLVILDGVPWESLRSMVLLEKTREEVMAAKKQQTKNAKEAAKYKPPTEFRFHDCHGINIELSDGGKVATRTKDCKYALVFSQDPLEINQVYEVNLTAIRRLDSRKFFHVGVTFNHPDSLRQYRFVEDMKYACLVHKDHISCYGQKVKNDMGDRLHNCRKGTTVGVCVDHKGYLRLYLNKTELGIVCQQINRKCYALFAVEAMYGQITALPLRPLPDERPSKSPRLQRATKRSAKETLLGDRAFSQVQKATLAFVRASRATQGTSLFRN